MIYLRYFGLERAPFSITPDTGFFFPHDRMQQVLNTLLVALQTGEGFIKVVGEVGCGKTVLCRRLLDTLAPDYVCAYLPNPELEPNELYQALCDELGVKTRASAIYALKKALTQTLLEHAGAGRKVVVCIDEAQAMPIRTLESLRLLSNIETEQHKLLHIVLFGQPELDTKLQNSAIRQLLQRITFSEQLGGLDDADVERYLAHRLKIAGADRVVFEPPAVKALARASRGVPRLINVLAHKALLLAFGEGAAKVMAHHVHLASSDTPSSTVPGRLARWFGFLRRPLFSARVDP